MTRVRSQAARGIWAGVAVALAITYLANGGDRFDFAFLDNVEPGEVRKEETY